MVSSGFSSIKALQRCLHSLSLPLIYIAGLIRVVAAISSPSQRCLLPAASAV